jgi:vancomycin resistance protein YoaR
MEGERLDPLLQERLIRYLLIPLGALIVLCSLSVAILFITDIGRVCTGVAVDDLRLGGMNPRQAAAAIESRFPEARERQLVLSFKGQSEIIAPQIAGVYFNGAGTAERAWKIGRTGSFWKRIKTRWKARWYGLQLQPVYRLDEQQFQKFYKRLSTTYNHDVVPASVAVYRGAKIQIIQSVDGRFVNKNRLFSELQATYISRSGRHLAKLPLQIIRPELTSAELTRYKFDQILGAYTTRFDASLYDRVHNLRLATAKIHNYILQPGTELSYNKVVGKRDKASGYRDAPIIFDGRLVPGLAGGICQVSSTLYNAILFANLEIKTRYNHALPSSYVGLARDATVTEDGLDLIAKNNTNVPLIFSVTIAPPYITVAVLGEKSGWKTVDLKSVVIENRPFITKQKLDPNLPFGAVLKTRNGQNGMKVQLWRIVTLIDGQKTQKLENTSLYPLQNEEYLIGTKMDGIFTAPAGTTSP